MLKFARQLFSISISLLLFALLSSTTRFWRIDGRIWLDSGIDLILPVIILLFIALLIAKGKIKDILSLEPEAFVIGLVLVFLSDWLCRGYSLLQGPIIRGEIILGAVISYGLIRNRLVNVISYFVPLALIVLITSFLMTCNGELLFSDDHSSFYYRLMLLKENFPNIPFYNPLWNGGIESREFFPSGILNVFFLTSPLIYLFDVEKIYTVIVTIIMLVITPGATYLACRLEKLNRPIPALAALLAVCSSLTWYEWALVYGTIGFITSISLAPILIIIASKILSKDDQLTFIEVILAIICGTLMLFWSLSGIVFIPLILAGLLLIKRVLKKRYVLSIALVLFLINIPWIIIFIQASNVLSFMDSEKEATVVTSSNAEVKTTDTNLDNKNDMAEITNPAGRPQVKRRKYKHRAGSISFSETKKFIRTRAANSNLLLIFMAFPGICLLRRRTKITYLLIGLWLLFLGSVAVPLKPQLELDRMLIILVFLFAIPAAVAVYELIRRAVNTPNIYNTLLCAFAGGFVFASPLSVASVLQNRTLEHFYFKNSTYQSLAEAIKTQAPPDGRIIFTGFILHELSHGHIAPLALETKHPLIASSYQHDKWWYTDVIPVEYLKQGSLGMEKYFDLYNVTAVIAHERIHKNYFLKHPEKYELLWKGNEAERGFMLFKRTNYESNYFLKGSGKILDQTSNHVLLELDTPEAVIKFTYFPFVLATKCEVSKEEISEHVSFIKLSKCPLHEPVKVFAKNAVQRFFLDRIKGNK